MYSEYINDDDDDNDEDDDDDNEYHDMLDINGDGNITNTATCTLLARTVHTHASSLHLALKLKKPFKQKTINL